jgi:hypothetical protein
MRLGHQRTHLTIDVRRNVLGVFTLVVHLHGPLEPIHCPVIAEIDDRKFLCQPLLNENRNSRHEAVSTITDNVSRWNARRSVHVLIEVSIAVKVVWCEKNLRRVASLHLTFYQLRR